MLSGIRGVSSTIGKFIASSRRVFIISRKPTWSEYAAMAKVTGIGIIIIALIGFVLQLLFAMTGIGF